MSWSAPLYDGGSPVLYYNVYRGDTLLAQVTSNAYVDDSVAMAAASSSYHVTAVNQVGESVAAFHTGACINLTSSPPAVHPINCAESVVDFVLWLIDNTP